MIHSVSVKETTFAKPPHCYEGGTPPAAEAIALAVALEYLQKIGLEKIQKHVSDLTRQAIEGLEQIEEVRLLGPVDQLKAMGHLVSFEVKGMHAHDVAALLDQYGVCVRAGHHCAQPLAIALGYVASVRASFYLYSTSDDSERFLQHIPVLSRFGE